MTRQHPDYYSVLDAQPSADTAEIRKKYRKAALRLHPDKGGNSEAFQLLTLAFEVLSCPVARAGYDRTLTVSTIRRNKTKGAKLRGSCHPERVILKRSAPVSAAVPKPKHQSKVKADSTGLKERMDRIGIPLRQLRDVLQHMRADERRTALQTLPPSVQAGLMLFMETIPNTSASNERFKSFYGHHSSAPKTTAVSGISAEPNARTSKAAATYNAHVHIKALRFYTRGYHKLEVALDRQMVLVQIRQALHTASSENPNFWDNPSAAYQICSKVLSANATSEHDLGLSAFVYFRAGHWLVQSHTIISPVMPLEETLQLHARLLYARRTSWHHLRAEWIQLMQSPWLPLTKRKTYSEAEATADAARSSALKMQLQRAANSAARALNIEELRKSHRSKVQARRQVSKERREARVQARAAAAERRAFKSQLDAWKVRQRWSKRTDLTMDDIMRGPSISFAVSC